MNESIPCARCGHPEHSGICGALTFYARGPFDPPGNGPCVCGIETYIASLDASNQSEALPEDPGLVERVRKETAERDRLRARLNGAQYGNACLSERVRELERDAQYGKRQSITLSGECEKSGATCCVCGGSVCTREECTDHPLASELTTGEWCCSQECWDIAASDYAEKQRAENARLAQKVAELESENARLREALERIFLMDKCPSPGDGCSQCIARAALAPAPKEDHA